MTITPFSLKCEAKKTGKKQVKTIPDFTANSAEIIKRFMEFIKDPSRLPKEFSAPVKPVVKCSFGSSKKNEVQMFKAAPWDLPIDKDCELDESYIPLLDVHCNGFVVVETDLYYLCKKNGDTDELHYLHHEKKSTKKDRNMDETKGGDCCEKFYFEYYTLFKGFLRLYEKDNVFYLVGLEMNTSGKAIPVYHVEILPDSKEFLLNCLDFEEQIILLAQNDGELPTKDENDCTVYEAVLLEFPSSMGYNVLSAILKCRQPSKYGNFIEDIKSDPSFIVKHSPQEVIIGVKGAALVKKEVSTETEKDRPAAKPTNYCGVLNDMVTRCFADLKLT